jgi:NAD(P)-dependent dehydrogenase (short-subunit alcohol dehydrogenase family)
LILKGNVKKVINLATGFADDALTVKYDLELAAPYAISKAAMNTTIAKYSAEFRKDGVLFLSVAPGVVDTGHNDNGKSNCVHALTGTKSTFTVTEEQMKSLMTMGAKFAQYAPHFTGPITAEESIKLMLSVIEGASIEKGDAGAFVSQFGNKQWL